MSLITISGLISDILLNNSSLSILITLCPISSIKFIALVSLSHVRNKTSCPINLSANVRALYTCPIPMFLFPFTANTIFNLFISDSAINQSNGVSISIPSYSFITKIFTLSPNREFSFTNSLFVIKNAPVSLYFFGNHCLFNLSLYSGIMELSFSIQHKWVASTTGIVVSLFSSINFFMALSNVSVFNSGDVGCNVITISYFCRSFSI